MTDHIDTAAEREKLAAILSETYLRCESCNEDMNCHDPSVMWLHHGKPICDDCADESEIRAEELDSAPDPVRVAHRLLDALDAERARAEKAEAECAMLREACGAHHVAAMKEAEKWIAVSADRDDLRLELAKTLGLTGDLKISLSAAGAERDQALARLAVAYEVAEELCKRRYQDYEQMVLSAERRGPSRPGYICDSTYHHWSGRSSAYYEIATDIRALTPADAEAALQRVVDAAWNEAVEACASHCWARRDLLADAEKKQVEAGLTGRDYYGRRLEAGLLSRSLRALKRHGARQ